MPSQSALRARDDHVRVRPLARLVRDGWTYSEIRAQLAAVRWQRFGVAVVLHNAPLTRDDRHAVALLNAGPGAVLTAFTCLEVRGLNNWSRTETHVLVPGGRHVVRIRGVPVHVHYSSRWADEQTISGRRLHAAAPAFVRATAVLPSPRSACGLLAAGVQQGIVTARELLDAVACAPRTRHRRTLIAAIGDIAQGAQALSAIDFARLCRKSALPEPVRQAIRVEPGGRRRYLDAEWRLGDGRRLVVEVDGALHLAASRWWADQVRQNELVIAGDPVLRFPSVVLRCEQHVVVDQLRRMLR